MASIGLKPGCTGRLLVNDGTMIEYEIRLVVANLITNLMLSYAGSTCQNRNAPVITRLQLDRLTVSTLEATITAAPARSTIASNGQ